jgi:hypothetical protein
VVAAVRFLVTVLFLSGGGALRISVVRRLSSPSSAASGFVEFFVPHPDRGRPIWLLMLLLVEMVLGFVKVTTALGAGPQGPLSGDFPAARGRLPIQACSGAAADPARHRLVLAGVDFVLQKDPFVISALLLILSVIWKL